VFRTASTTRILMAAALLAAVAIVSAVGARAYAAPPLASPTAQFLRVGDRTTTNGRLETALSISLPRATPSVRVRYRLYRPDGKVVLQATESLRATPAGSRILTFDRELTPLGIPEGVYRLEAVVRAGTAAPVTAVAPVYVTDAKRGALPLAVVVRLATTPMRDPDGTFVIDPAADTAHAQAYALAELARVRPDLRLTAALAPFALDDWRSAAAGYSLASTGSVPVSADATPATAARRALDGLAEATRAGALSWVRVGYGDPDVAGLERVRALDDLGAHLDLAAISSSDTVGPVAPRGVAVSGGRLPRSALPALAARRAAFLLLSPDAARLPVKGRDTTPPAGIYTIAETTMTAVIVDGAVSDALAASAAQPRAVLDTLFARLTSKSSSGTPVIAVVDVGPDSGATVEALQAALTTIARTGWVRLVTVDEAAALRSRGSVSLAASVDDTAAAAPAVWDAIARARSRTLALASSAGANDADASVALAALLVAESSAWRTEGAPRDLGAAYAQAADDRAWGVLSRATLAIPNVTLSGSTGRVPVSVHNGTDRPLLLTLRAVPRGVALPRSPSTTFIALPGENIQSVRVDMGSALTGSIHFELDAGPVTIAEGDSTVRASYMDRLAIIVMVVLVLLLLLWYIRRKGAGTLDRLRQPTSG